MMPDLWNANDPSQYHLDTPPALVSAYQQADKMSDQIHHPQNDEDYNIIPMGAYYVNPEDNQIYQKSPGNEDIPQFSAPQKQQPAPPPGILT